MMNTIFASSCLSAHQDMQTGQQFVKIKGLDHVIITTSQQPIDTMAARITCSQNQYRQVITLFTPTTQHGHAVLIRQAKIQYADIKVRESQCRVRQTGGINMIDRQAMQAKTRENTVRDKLII